MQTNALCHRHILIAYVHILALPGSVWGEKESTNVVVVVVLLLFFSQVNLLRPRLNGHLLEDNIGSSY